MAQNNADAEGHGDVEGGVGRQGEGQIAEDSTPDDTYDQIDLGLDLDGEKNGEEDTYNRWSTIKLKQLKPDDGEETYSVWSTVTPEQQRTRGTKACILNCSLKRTVVVLVVFCILLSVTVIVLSVVLAHHIKYKQAGFSPSIESLANTNTTVIKADTTSSMSTLASIPVQASETTISPNSTLSTSTTITTPAETTAAVSTTTAAATTAIRTTTTTGATKTITSTTTTTTLPAITSAPDKCTGSRRCHSCSSFSFRCPANGDMGNTTAFGMVEDCDCSVPCFNEVRNGREVHRGCVSGKGSIWEEKAQNLECQFIVNGAFACFCFGYLCNDRDMTPYIAD